MGKKNDNTLVKNASFLMIAALISKIIGMLYKVRFPILLEITVWVFSIMPRMFTLSC